MKMNRISIPGRNFHAERIDEKTFALKYLSAPITVTETYVRTEANKAWWGGQLVTIDGTDYPPMGTWASISGRV